MLLQDRGIVRDVEAGGSNPLTPTRVPKIRDGGALHTTRSHLLASAALHSATGPPIAESPAAIAGPIAREA